MTMTDDTTAEQTAQHAYDHALDCDSHEMMPMQFWPEAFGDAGHLLDRFADVYGSLGQNSLYRPDINGDDHRITEATVWEEKGPGAPGAIDVSVRRREVLDVMGVDRQLIFPSFAISALMLEYNPRAHEWFGFEPGEFDNHGVACAMVEGHNAWAARVSRENPDGRIRPVAVLLSNSVEEMIETAERAIENGVRAVNVQSGLPPAQMSPADRRLDPLWQLCERTDTAVVLHLGTEFGFLKSDAWDRNVPEFVPATFSQLEFPLQPMRLAQMSMMSENFTAAMILGGVFERFPRLRFGVIECSAWWVGPLAERMDIISEVFAKRLTSLSMRPSEYLARNVRVTPFIFEDVAMYYERHPELADVFVYSTDYPHKEGGEYSKKTFYDALKPLGDEVVTKFFRSNGEWLLPKTSAE